MWHTLRNDLARIMRVPLLIGIAIAVMVLAYDFLHYVPKIYFGQSGHAARLAQIASGRAHSAKSKKERVFYRREAAWYRVQSYEICWREFWYALRPGYDLELRDEESDAELTIRDLATRERLDQHGFGWSRYQRLAENHAEAAAEESKRLLHQRAADDSDVDDLKRLIEWHSRSEQYYLRAASHPWETLPAEPPRP